MRPEEVCNPTPEQMTTALVEAAQARRWNHCMYPDRGKKYCQRWGEQGKLFVEVRW
jgi:hypothetical protein